MCIRDSHIAHAVGVNVARRPMTREVDDDQIVRLRVDAQSPQPLANAFERRFVVGKVDDVGGIELPTLWILEIVDEIR